jgi:hypothetical protein
MYLALDRACANGAPRNEFSEVLGGKSVEEFTGDGKAAAGELEKEAAALAKAFCHVTGAVEVGVVEEALPAAPCARLFEIHPHYNVQRGVCGAESQKALGIFEGGVVVVNGAGSHNDKDAIRRVGACKNLFDFSARVCNEKGVFCCEGQFGGEFIGCWQGCTAGNPAIHHPYLCHFPGLIGVMGRRFR